MWAILNCWLFLVILWFFFCVIAKISYYFFGSYLFYLWSILRLEVSLFAMFRVIVKKRTKWYHYHSTVYVKIRYFKKWKRKKIDAIIDANTLDKGIWLVQTLTNGIFIHVDLITSNVSQTRDGLDLDKLGLKLVCSVLIRPLLF